MVYLLFFIFYQTGFIANVVWKTTAVQYFLGITLLTLFYYLSIIKKQTICFSLFVGFFIGLYDEIFMGVAIILSLAYFLDKKVSRETINKNILYFFVACTLGGVILILAPGNYVRLDTISSGRYATMFGNIYI